MILIAWMLVLITSEASTYIFTNDTETGKQAICEGTDYMINYICPYIFK
jgi:hypothetical protein